MNSADIREARDKLIAVANEMPFPMELKRYIFSEVLGIINTASEKEIRINISKKKAEVKPDE